MMTISMLKLTLIFITPKFRKTPIKFKLIRLVPRSINTYFNIALQNMQKIIYVSFNTNLKALITFGQFKIV